jgi:hypothetical protein
MNSPERGLASLMELKMQAGWVLEKTPLGRDELATHAHHLSPLVRGVLVLVNGQRSVSALLDCATDRTRWQEAIAQLLEQDFVRPLDVQSPEAGSHDARAGSMQSAQASATEFKSSFSSPAGFDAAGQDDLRAALSLLTSQMFGKQAEKLLQKLQAADNNAQGQRAALEGCVKYIRLFIDEKKATDFQRKAETLIEARTGQS